MIRNGYLLRDSKPVTPLVPVKVRHHGVSHGLAEAGYDIRIKQDLVLHPFRRFRLASTIERFQMPDDLVGVVHDKSTWVRKGLTVCNTVIEPSWEGFLTIELVHHGWWPLRIPAGAGIAQVLFHELATPARYNGKYQNQPDQPVPAIFTQL